MGDPNPAQSDSNHGAATPFSAELVFPDAKTLFTSRLKPIKSILSDCLVVLDTNVLLVPYTLDRKSLKQVERTYRKLASESRLFIPAQVAREFAKNRSLKLAEVYHQLTTRRSKLQNFHDVGYPLLEGQENYAALRGIEKELDDKLAKYKTALDRVIEEIRSWIWDDPVSVLYGKIFTPDVIFELSLTQSEILKDLSKRQQHRIPPGYKDAAKPDGGIGDVLIWHSILELGRTKKQDVIFVSGDEKADWWHQGSGRALYPRFELVDEFWRVSAGRSFHITKLSEILDLFGVSEEIVRDVQNQEAVAEPGHASLHAERGKRAVQRFIQRTYPDGTFLEIGPGGFDFVVLLNGGRKIGWTLKRVSGASNLARRWREMRTRLLFDEQPEVDEEVIVFIIDRSDDIAAAAAFFAKKELPGSRFVVILAMIGIGEQLMEIERFSVE